MSFPNAHGQDLPPRGAYPEVQIKRNLPGRGFSAGIVFLGVGAIVIWGHRRSQQAISERRELFRESQWARLHLIPLLEAESDRDLYRRQYAAMEREQEIMRDVPGWRAGDNVYHGQRFVLPEYLVAPPNAGERKVAIKEPRNWFWQRSKKENKE